MKSKIEDLFLKYEKIFPAEFDDENWNDFHYKTKQGGIDAVLESIKLIGDGEIEDLDFDHLRYKEVFNDNKLILVVHAHLSKSYVGGAKGYMYEVSVFENRYTEEQYGGGYGTSGFIMRTTPLLSHYHDYGHIFRNRNIISNVCKELKEMYCQIPN